MKRMEIKNMIREKTEALYNEENDSFKIFSPGIGMFRISVNNGEILYPGSIIGVLTVLGSKSRIRLPLGVSGKVEMPERSLTVFPIGYNDLIFSLKPLKESLENNSDHKDEISESEAGEDEIIIKAFISGVFYLRPSPDSEPFITPGSGIKKGAILGLIEVMKSFNQIVFSGDGKNRPGKIEKIFVEDSAEVEMGDPLFLVSFSDGGEN